MISVHPFQAVVPTRDRVREVASPPYDVVTYLEARNLALSNPLSFIRVLRAEIEFSPELDPYRDEVYEQARATYRWLKQENVLAREREPAFYLYSLVMDGVRQTGLVTLCDVDDYEANRIRKHEKTRPDKEADRTRHIMTLQAHTGLVFLTCPDHRRLEQLFDSVIARKPIFDFTADDGIGHTIWRIPVGLAPEFSELVREIPNLYIADGHHRAAAAAGARDRLRRANPAHTGRESYNFFPAVVFPAGQLRILPYNRVVKGLNGHTPGSLLEALSANFPVEKTEQQVPKRAGEVQLYLDGSWFRLALHDEKVKQTRVADRMDAGLLQNLVLAPILGIGDPRTDQRIDFIGGIKGTGPLVERVEKGQADLAFSLFPTTVRELMEIADRDEVMPPKSTWFEPKLRDGLLIHEFTR